MSGYSFVFNSVPAMTNFWTRLHLLSGLSLFHNVMDLGLASKFTGVGQMFMIQILAYSYTLLFFVYDFDRNGSFWAAVPLLRQTGSPRLLGGPLLRGGCYIEFSVTQLA